MVTANKRAEAWDRGRRAEQAVADWLQLRGFSLEGTNLRFGPLELDLVARRGSLVVVVEVRTRTSRRFTSAFGSLGRDKRERIQRAARRLWAQRYRWDPTVTHLRLDAASVDFTPSGARITYVAGALSAHHK